MISEAMHRGEMVYNIALRIDPNSTDARRGVSADSQCAAWLRHSHRAAPGRQFGRRDRRRSWKPRWPALQPEERIAQRCRSPGDRLRSAGRAGWRASKRTSTSCWETSWKRKPRTLRAKARDHGGRTEKLQKAASAGFGCGCGCRKARLRVDSARIDAVMNLVGRTDHREVDAEPDADGIRASAMRAIRCAPSCPMRWRFSRGFWTNCTSAC